MRYRVNYAALPNDDHGWLYKSVEEPTIEAASFIIHAMMVGWGSWKQVSFESIEEVPEEEGK